MNNDKKQLIKTMAIILGTITMMYLLITKVISPRIDNSTDITKGVVTFVSTIVMMYLANALLFALSLDELRKVLILEGSSFVLNYLPVTSDLKLRKYYAEFQNDLGSQGLGSLPVVINLVVSLVFILSATISLPLTLYKYGILYATAELEFAFVVTVLLFGLLQITRAICISKLIKASGHATYMANPGKYLMVSYIMAGGWAILFIAGPLLAIIGVNLVHPLLNILGLVSPIVVPSVLAYIGTKKMRKDLTAEYDMDIY